MRVLFFGMRGAFSVPPMRTLLAAGVDVCGVVLPARYGPPLREVAPTPTIMLGRAPTIVDLAREREIPVWECADLQASETLRTLGSLQPDLGCVACFERRIPRALLDLPRLGLLNVHPSLLPAYRGPVPLFWALRDAAPVGVTLHWLDEGLDTGPIALQRPVDLPDGCSGVEADKICATTGGQLLIEALAAVHHGELPRIPQPRTGTAAPWPAAADFALDPAWSARRAFNFMRGTAEWGNLYPLTVDGRQIQLAQAIGFDATARLATPITITGNMVRVQLAQGVLDATVEP